MKIYQLSFELDKYNTLKAVDRAERDKLNFGGQRRDNKWEPLAITKVENNKKFSDAPGLMCGVVVLNKKALNCLIDLIKEDIEVLPLKCDCGDFKAINVTSVLDCIDYENAEFKTFPDSKDIMVFYTYAFKPERIGNHIIFKIIDESESYAFVTDEFKKIVEINNLTGFKFELMWDSGTGAIKNAGNYFGKLGAEIKKNGAAPEKPSKGSANFQRKVRDAENK